MKKSILFVAILFCSLYSYAQQAVAEYTVPGLSGSITIMYFNDRVAGGNTNTGHLTIENTTGQTIQNAHIYVAVEISGRGTEIKLNETQSLTIPKKNKTLVLCDDNFVIPAGTYKQYKSNKGPVLGGPEYSDRRYTYSIDAKITPPSF
ncbi:MAG: hypothetical protein IJR13_07530 [Bacteroidales bacterium]|nr:hypothetical protein [Bacteroidales bacterium]